MSHAKFFLSSKWHFTIYYLKVSKNHVECDCRKWHLFKASAYSRRLLKWHDPYGILLSRVFGQTKSAMNRMLATECWFLSLFHCIPSFPWKPRKFWVMEYGALLKPCAITRWKWLRLSVRVLRFSFRVLRLSLDLESLAFKRFLENQKCIRIHIRLYLLLLATYNM